MNFEGESCFQDEFQNEDEITFENNNIERKRPPLHDLYGPDVINVFDITGKQIGYSWNYGDSIELCINMNNTVLRVIPDQLEKFKMYLSNKQVEINFEDMRGNYKYCFYVPADLICKLKLNDSEETLIDRNTYKVNLVLINPYDMSRISLLREPYQLYVK